MLIISVRGNENSRWKRNAKTTIKKTKQTDKDRKEEAGTGSIVKEWELNDFFYAFKLGFLMLTWKMGLYMKNKFNFEWIKK